MSETQAEMPKYKCNKEVWGLKIEEIVNNPNESIDLFFEEKGYASLNMTKDDLEGKPTPETGWYYVVYKGGYKSFSPADVFEDGYTKV